MGEFLTVSISRFAIFNTKGEIIGSVGIFTGWSAGADGVVIKTTNGGFSWNIQSSGTTLTLRKIQFVTSNIGWIVGGDINPQPNPFCMYSSVILKTTNGGQNWSARIQTNFGAQLNDLSVLDTGNAYAVGESIDNTQCIMGLGTTSKTTDGGSNWNGISTPISTGFIYKSLTFLNNSTGYFSAIASSDVISRIRKILKTTNAGVNWSISTTDSLNGTPTFENNFLRFFDANTVDTNHVWACGVNGKIVYGGKEIMLDTIFAGYVALKTGNAWTYIMDDPLVPPGIEVHRNTIFKDSIFNNHQYFYTNAFEGLSWILLKQYQAL
ncbi:unnamed protein product [Rotaria sp. Silwood1]|nr:unnamed protein product [Rotaria sp. Silwood1]